MNTDEQRRRQFLEEHLGSDFVDIKMPEPEKQISNDWDKLLRTENPLGILGEINETEKSELLDLGEEAKNVLGYNPLHDEMTRSEKPNDFMLRSIMNDLGIRIFKSKDVTDYMNAKQKEVSEFKGVRHEWSSYLLEDYHKEVPVEILKNALRIRKECRIHAVPNQFQILDLEQEYTSGTTNFSEDPFIGVCVPQEWPNQNDCLYFGVWDEPEFKGKSYSPFDERL